MLLHAIMDALLGAAALGDIGKHFPDTDPAYKGASSIELLKHVGKLIDEKLYVIGNIDATIIAQRPKMAPHIEKKDLDLPEQVKVFPHRRLRHWIRLPITVIRSVRRPAAAQDVVAARMWESKGGQDKMQVL